jgi:hypothetical protein
MNNAKATGIGLIIGFLMLAALVGCTVGRISA